RIQMAAMPIATPAPFGGPVVVVGQQFCAPRGVDLTVTKKAFSLTGSDFAVTDVDGNVVLKVKGVYFSLRDRCVLVDAAGNPLLTLQLKSTESKDLLFSVKKSSLLQFKTKLDVIMASNTNEDACDFKIKGSYFERSCTVYLGESNSKIAQGDLNELRQIGCNDLHRSYQCLHLKGEVTECFYGNHHLPYTDFRGWKSGVIEVTLMACRELVEGSKACREFVKSLLGVRRELAEGEQELVRMASRIRQKKTKRLAERLLRVVKKLVGS
ncbi:hypothetical protein BHE74_00056062, partial [Ensete ventricosum]